jgi:hypothetical protein
LTTPEIAAAIAVPSVYSVKSFAKRAPIKLARRPSTSRVATYNRMRQLVHRRGLRMSIKAAGRVSLFMPIRGVPAAYPDGV